MRVRYIGLDNRTRIAEMSRIKFLSDGFQDTDTKAEVVEGLEGPLIVLHLVRTKGGKRLILAMPGDFNIEAAKAHLLETGWLDLSYCPLKMENLYT